MPRRNRESVKNVRSWNRQGQEGAEGKRCGITEESNDRLKKFSRPSGFKIEREIERVIEYQIINSPSCNGNDTRGKIYNYYYRQ